jgi:hypothetical protein
MLREAEGGFTRARPADRLVGVGRAYRSPALAKRECGPNQRGRSCKPSPVGLLATRRQEPSVTIEKPPPKDLLMQRAQTAARSNGLLQRGQSVSLPLCP